MPSVVNQDCGRCHSTDAHCFVDGSDRGTVEDPGDTLTTSYAHAERLLSTHLRFTNS
jgi:hypothetical protein